MCYKVVLFVMFALVSDRRDSGSAVGNCGNQKVELGSTSGRSAAVVGDDRHSCTTGVSFKMNGRRGDTAALPGFV